MQTARDVPAGAGTVRRAIWALAVAVAASCTPGPSATASAVNTDNAAVQRAFERHAENVELTVTGIVDRLLSDQNGPSGPHQRFIVRLSDVGLTVLVEHNLSLAPRVPVVAGEPVVVHGEYVWNAQGGLLHFTHHDPDRSHEGGYILYAGTRYD